MVARVLVLAWLAATVLMAPAAQAHVELAASSPEAGADVAEPLSTVRLEFSGPLQADGDHAVGLFDADEERVDDGETVQISDTEVEVGVESLPATGAYTVRWLVIAGDGHTLDGSYEFTYSGPVEEPSPSPEPSPEETLQPASEAETEEPAQTDDGGADGEEGASPAPSPVSTTGPGGTGALVGLVATVLAVAAVGFGAMSVRRRNRDAADAGDAGDDGTA